MKFQKTIQILDLDKFDYSKIQRGQWISHGQHVYGQFMGVTKSKTVVILHKREYSKNYMAKWNQNLIKLKAFALRNA